MNCNGLCVWKWARSLFVQSQFSRSDWVKINGHFEQNLVHLNIKSPWLNFTFVHGNFSKSRTVTWTENPVKWRGENQSGNLCSTRKPKCALKGIRKQFTAKKKSTPFVSCLFRLDNSLNIGLIWRSLLIVFVCETTKKGEKNFSLRFFIFPHNSSCNLSHEKFYVKMSSVVRHQSHSNPKIKC